MGNNINFLRNGKTMAQTGNIFHTSDGKAYVYDKGNKMVVGPNGFMTRASSEAEAKGIIMGMNGGKLF